MVQTQMNARILNFPGTLAQPIGHQHRGPGRLPQGVFSIKGQLVARRAKLRRELSEKQSELQDAMRLVDELTAHIDKVYGVFYGLTVDRVKTLALIEELKAEIEQVCITTPSRMKTGHALAVATSPLDEALTRTRARFNQVGG